MKTDDYSDRPCPDCGGDGNHVEKDFDPDVGYFYRCPETGEYWSVTEAPASQEAAG